ncbi:3'5'-cyclic nucleotide phosphodiesterase domain-containing protein [Cardiosporidium cionae]|uniref:3'5'-cyclic nucleotide phosphodiesterase domain-containing protein n=1 Tax=Cardiosporidium cionae TaxID=476202 RepID=A0ABQ7J800_9APIC|nr:3'5'-cyclic nucleotide phosphodiesterase domain-containing protein [Cardiosporidium cionae]|eukprot:KAF8820131.1 3'5'-cyclic nucleotide phosphodiesterase domain-containing protein [Cardiosporidium cionae]
MGDTFDFDIFEFAKIDPNILVSCYTFQENIPFPTPPTASRTFTALTMGCGYNLNLNLFEISEQKEFANNLIVEVGSLLIGESLAVIKSGTAWKAPLLSLLGNIQRSYRKDTSYHNALHAAEVAHLLVCLLNRMKLIQRSIVGKHTLTELRFLSLFAGTQEQGNTPPSQQITGGLGFVVAVLSALAHDAAHPGKTNNFLINSGMPLALIYNDKSVLENYHSCILFQLLKQHSNNIFSSLSFSDWRMVRRIVIEMILATDMAFHFELIGELRARRQAANFKYLLNETDGWILVKNCLKMADIGHAFLSWDLHKEFSIRVCKEIIRQSYIYQLNIFRLIGKLFIVSNLILPLSKQSITSNAQCYVKRRSAFAIHAKIVYIDWAAHVAFFSSAKSQEEEEIRLKLPRSPLCLKNNLQDIPKSQRSFLQFVKANSEKWEAVSNSGTQIADIEERLND